MSPKLNVNLDQVSDNIPAIKNSDLGKDTTTIATIVALVFKVVMIISGAIFLIIFLIASFRYLVSGSNEENTASAKQQMIESVIGMAIILAVYGAGTWVLLKFGLI